MLGGGEGLGDVAAHDGDGASQDHDAQLVVAMRVGLEHRAGLMPGAADTIDLSDDLGPGPSPLRDECGSI